jgi:hypothetical protein
MPIYVFQCPICLRSRDVLQSYDAAPPRCEHDTTEMVRIPAVSAFHVRGLSAANGYTPKRSIPGPSMNGIKTHVTGNFEGFSDRVVPE